MLRNFQTLEVSFPLPQLHLWLLHVVEMEALMVVVEVKLVDVRVVEMKAEMKVEVKVMVVEVVGAVDHCNMVDHLSQRMV